MRHKGVCTYARGEAPLWDIESRVQGADGVQGELLLLRVYVEL